MWADQLNCELLIAPIRLLYYCARMKPVALLTHIVGYFGCQFTGTGLFCFWPGCHDAIALSSSCNGNEVRQTRQKQQQHATGSSESRLDVEKPRQLLRVIRAHDLLRTYVYVYTKYSAHNEAFSISFRFSVLIVGRRHSMKFNKIKTISKRKQKRAKEQNNTKKKKKMAKWVRLGALAPGTHDKRMTMSPAMAEWSLAFVYTERIRIRVF